MWLLGLLYCKVHRIVLKISLENTDCWIQCLHKSSMLCVVSSQHWPIPTYLEGKAPHGMHHKLARCEGTGLSNLTSSAQLEDRKIKTTFYRPHPCSYRFRWDPMTGTCAKQTAGGAAEAVAGRPAVWMGGFSSHVLGPFSWRNGRNAGGSLLSIPGSWSHSLVNVLSQEPPDEPVLHCSRDRPKAQPPPPRASHLSSESVSTQSPVSSCLK